MTSNDGTCPIQKSLHVQSYPTLILVDRQGHILWQDQGANRATLSRLDKMVTLATQGESRRALTRGKGKIQSSGTPCLWTT